MSIRESPSISKVVSRFSCFITSFHIIHRGVRHVLGVETLLNIFLCSALIGIELMTDWRSYRASPSKQIAQDFESFWELTHTDFSSLAICIS